VKRDAIHRATVTAFWLADDNSSERLVYGLDDRGYYLDLATGAYFKASQVSDLVPLVTLTKDDARAVLTMTARSRAAAHALDRLSAQLEPPRMDEPTEFGAMVEATKPPSVPDRSLFMRVNAPNCWHCEEGGFFQWHELLDPRPVKDNS
jgi:hypothetical protein